MPIDWEALAAPLPADQIEWRASQAGETNGKVWCRVVPYVTNRGIMNRLDEVVGPANWKNEYQPGPAGGVICGLSIRVDGEWITKWDGAENTEIESVRGGLSDAMKRAAVHWGLARYLYSLEEAFAEVSENGAYRGKTKDGKLFRWNAPPLPAWALPKPRTNAKEREHADLMAFLRDAGARAPAHVQTTIREKWEDAKQKYAVADALRQAVEASTGEKFQPSPVA